LPPAFGKDPPSDKTLYMEWLFLNYYGYYSYLGMSYEEYWNGDPRLVRCYREAHEMKRESKNQELHLQGFYIYEAFSSVMEDFAIGLSGKRGKKATPYPEMPIPITEREKGADKARKVAKTYEYLAKAKAIAQAKERSDGDR